MKRLTYTYKVLIKKMLNLNLNKFEIFSKTLINKEFREKICSEKFIFRDSIANCRLKE